MKKNEQKINLVELSKEELKKVSGGRSRSRPGMLYMCACRCHDEQTDGESNFSKDD